MSKGFPTHIKIQYICQNCGESHPRWSGQCEYCNEWNTLIEERATQRKRGNTLKKEKISKTQTIILKDISLTSGKVTRMLSGMGELDRVTGGGFVPGSAILIGGDPGIGKSTLLIQTAAALTHKGHHVIYISGEESIRQIHLRAHRLDLAHTSILLAAETNLENIFSLFNSLKDIDLVILDSIQTLWSHAAESSSPGTIAQVKICAQLLISFAKESGTTIILVGHVTKDGQIAGPRVVEHMVDSVLYLEGESNHQYRILRTVKNRFGATDEIGIFEMSKCGLNEVSNPSKAFLSERNGNTPGAAVFAGMKGTRTVLVEIQALVSPSALGIPRRTVLGWDGNRLSMILAVLENHGGIGFSNHDVYLNVAGGYRITEPAADLAVVAALISSLTNISLPSECVYFGEISLSGSFRAVTYTKQRLKEIENIGFQTAVLPYMNLDTNQLSLKLHPVTQLPDIIAHITSLNQTTSNRD
ncbi:MAG: DNA repair protein [Candidatus Tokpelaia sp. JSC161]|nr:MAG: DNA repair protein [Candidatus Tokpelaia sp. JSC161]